MAGLRKSELFDQVEEGFRLGGWKVLYLSGHNRNPTEYVIFQSDQRYRVKVYIWTVTPGGKSRPVDEFRIQPTATKQFIPEVGGKTLILGWWPQADVFAGFDLRRHSGPLGSSPSFQIGESALRHAAVSGFAPYKKASGELAVAFQPDFLGTYVQYLEEIHDSGAVPKEISLLEKLGSAPENVEDKEISKKVAKKRRFAFSQTRRALRDINFSKRVFTAYGHRCAMCGIQLRLLEGAHIVPVAERDSTDETSNGIALCALHHKAYDDSLVTFDEKYRVHLNNNRIKELKKSSRDEGLPAFRKALRTIIYLPPDQRDRPDPDYVEQANDLRGWTL
jgi:putative restriction endonuclease